MPLYQTVVFIFLSCTALAVLFLGERGPRVGFLFYLITFAIGYRTVEITPKFGIHPSEVILWWAFFVSMIQQAVFRRKAFRLSLPLWIWCLVPFWMWAWFLGKGSWLPWDLMLGELRNFLALIPLFYLTRSLHDRGLSLREIFNFFSAAGIIIAILGILEYFFPGPMALLASSETPEAYYTTGGFFRAKFAFYGSPCATFVCLLSWPMTACLQLHAQTPRKRLFLFGCVVIQILAIAIGGYRTLWAFLMIQFLFWCLLRFGLAKAQVLFLPALALLFILPSSYQSRFDTLVLALEGHAYAGDSSSIKRLDRLRLAWHSILERPLGWGWSASGWPHSDFLRVAVNQGIIAGLIFLAAFLNTLILVLALAWKRRRQFHDGPTLQALAVSFLGAGSLLVSQDTLALPQLCLPILTVWALTEVFSRDQRQKPLVPIAAIGKTYVDQKPTVAKARS